MKHLLVFSAVVDSWLHFSIWRVCVGRWASQDDRKQRGKKRRAGIEAVASQSASGDCSSVSSSSSTDTSIRGGILREGHVHQGPRFVVGGPGRGGRHGAAAVAGLAGPAPSRIDWQRRWRGRWWLQWLWWWGRRGCRGRGGRGWRGRGRGDIGR